MTSNEGIGTLSDAEMAAHLADPAWVHCVSLVARPHLHEFMHDLEFAHYAPGSTRNDDFQIRLTKWGGLHWAVVSVPASDRHLMEAAAARHSLRLAEDSAIVMAGGGNLEKFPWTGERVFVLQPALKKPESVP